MNKPETILLKDLKDNRDTFIKTHKIAFKNEFDTARLYYSTEGFIADYKTDYPVTGFNAYYVSITGGKVEKGVSTWDSNLTEVEVVIKANAFFDGVRHLYFNPVTEDARDRGYLYYPDIPELIKVLQEINNLQNKYGLE